MSDELERFAAIYRKQVGSAALSGADILRIWLQISARLQDQERRNPSGERKLTE